MRQKRERTSKYKRCNRCRVRLTPGANWYNSYATKRRYICKKCAEKLREEKRLQKVANGEWVCSKCGIALPPNRKKTICEQCTRDYYKNYKKTIIKCVICGKKLKKWQHKYCKNCSVEVGRLKDSERSKANYYKIREELLDSMGGKCLFCGKKHKLHCHHIIPLISNDTKFRQYYHYIRHKDFLLLICGDCHIKWHELKEWLELFIM